VWWRRSGLRSLTPSAERGVNRCWCSTWHSRTTAVVLKQCSRSIDGCRRALENKDVATAVHILTDQFGAVDQIGTTADKRTMSTEPLHAAPQSMRMR
jgi:hypothetical protein